MVEFYGRICCNPTSKKVSYTGPIKGDKSGQFAAVRPAEGGGSIQHAYPKTDPRVFCPKGTCVVAYYHTHPSSPNFSKNDKRYIQGGTVSYYMSNGDVLKRIDPQREKGVDDLKGGELALPNGEYAISPRVVDLKIASEE